MDRRRQILDAALAVADEQGLSAVSMRAVATRVGLSPMALYPYVGGKDELLDGLVDRMLGESIPDDMGTGLASRMRAIAAAARSIARAHPAVFPLLFARPAVTPDAVRAVDLIYQTLLDAGVPPAEVPRLERLTTTFVLGFVTSEANGRFGTRTASARSIRAKLGDLPGHEALAGVLEQPVDWDAEFDADIADLVALIERVAAGN